MHSMLELKKVGRGRMWSSSFVQPDWSAAQPKLQCGVWTSKIAQVLILEDVHPEWPQRWKLCARGAQCLRDPASPRLHACPAEVQGHQVWQGVNDRFMGKGRGQLNFLTNQPPRLFSMQSSRVCTSACGHTRVCYNIMPGWFWSTACKEKPCIRLNCLIMLQDGLSMWNGPQTSCLFTSLLEQTSACSSHYSTVGISLLLWFLFPPLASCIPWPDTWLNRPQYVCSVAFGTKFFLLKITVKNMESFYFFPSSLKLWFEGTKTV